jgi:VanZ family protein
VAATVEVLQVLIPARTPTAIDIVLAVIGATVGGAIALGKTTRAL